jgi:hypothetical protein
MSTTSRWYDQIERYEGVSMDSAEAILTKSQAISLKRIADALEIIAAADRLDELERENARLRAALEEIARVDVGGLQGIAEDHRFDADDYDKKEALAKLQAWHDEENVYLMGRIADRRSRARAALAGSGEK